MNGRTRQRAKKRRDRHEHDGLTWLICPLCTFRFRAQWITQWVARRCRLCGAYAAKPE